MCHGKSQLVSSLNCPILPKYVSEMCLNLGIANILHILQIISVNINEAAFTADHVGGITEKYFRAHLD